MSVIDSFERDLVDCGVPYSEVRQLAIRYARALETSSHIDWIELYIGLFATLHRNLNRTGHTDRDALARILLLINDDLGSELFAEEARAELAGAAVVAR